VRIVVNGRFSQYKTGVGRVIENYLVQLARLDTRNEYFIHVNREFAHLRFDNDRFHVLSNGVPAAASAANHLWTQTGLPRSIRKHRANLLLLPQINLMLVKLAPTILFQHDLIEYHLNNQRLHKMLFRRFALPRAINLADRIISVSQSTTADIERFFPAALSRTTTILSGVDLGHLRPLDPVEARETVSRRFPVQGPYILYVGTLTEPQKNLIRLVEAFALLRRRGLKLSLLLAGAHGKDSGAIFARAEQLGLAGDIVAPGYVADEDLSALYSGCEAFYFASLHEGFGLPVLEAMACGAAVVTSTTSSLPEVAGDAALLVDPRSVEAIAGALHRIVTDSDLRTRLGRKARQRAGQFRWESAGRALLEEINRFDPSAPSPAARSEDRV